jgi:hypothetical protein
MIRATMSSLRALSILAVVGLSTALAAQKPVPEPRIGLAFSPPKGWLELPADGDRHATLRLYAAPRALASKGDTTHTPLMRVMFFKKGGDAANDVVDGLPRMTPFRSLEDFCKRGLGAKDVSLEPGKVGTLEGQKVNGKNIPGDLVLFGQTVALDDGEAAVCVEVLSLQAEKIKKEIDAALTSLSAVARTPATRLDPPWVVDADWSKKDVASRNTARRKWAEELVAAAAKSPEAGFTVFKAKYWTVLSAADAAFTKKAIAGAELARAWCAQKMPEITKEPPLPAVLRIFDNPDHYAAFLTTEFDQRDYNSRRRELYFVLNKDNAGITGFSMLFRSVLWQVFDDVDAGVLPAMPRWFDNGCWSFMFGSRFDGKKLEFIQNDSEKGRAEYYVQHKEPMLPLWALMQEKKQPSPEDGSTERGWDYQPECSRLMRWFWMNDGQKAFDKPALVCDYVRALGAAHAKLGPDPTLDVATLNLSKDELKEFNSRHYKWRDAMLIATNDIAIPLKVEVWTAINDKWLEFNKTFK